MINIENNKVYCDGHTFIFKHGILDAELVNKKLLIVFNPHEPGYSKDNIYCFSLNQDLLWKISKPPTEMVGTMQLPYIGISISDGVYGAVDFYGRRFIFDIETGKIIGRDIVK